MSGARPFGQLSAVAAVMRVDNVDTDQIIPSREMKAVSRTGLGAGLFAGWRYTEPGGREPRADFVLNRPEQAGTEILISGRNFGCGSSREHAVWALAEYGIRAIIAESFGEIFFNNCIRNGICPVALPADDVERLAAHVAGDPAHHRVRVDLAARTVTAKELEDFKAHFTLGAFDARMLAEGLDPIGLTEQSAAEIDAFLVKDKARRPWLYS